MELKGSSTERVFGVDIGGSKTAVSVLDAASKVREITRFQTGTPEATLANVIAAIGRESPGESPIIGVACGGPLDANRGVVQSPPNLPGWDDVPVVGIIRERFKGRVFLMNDANANALAEWTFGAGHGCKSMVFLTAGTGMGAGLILDGRLHEGATGDAGEVGHLRLASEGPIGFGKAGSFEGFCSGAGIARLAKKRAETAGRTIPADISAAKLADDARHGDAFSLGIWQESGTRLGEALAVLIDVLNPERIVIGSLFVRCQDLLEAPMQEAIAREALPRSAAACSVVPAALGETVGNHGAIAVALYHSFHGKES